MNYEFELQLFAEGGAPAAAVGGESAAPTAQPSEARLRELGVPEDRLQKRAKRGENRRSGNQNERKPSAPAEQPTLSNGGNGGEQNKQVQQEQKIAVPPANKHTYDFRAHFDGMTRQAAEMAGKYPDFNLQKELDNPTFLRLTAPEIGLPLEDAYMALHHRDVTRAISERSRQELSNSIRAGSARPVEHGIGAKAPSMVTFDYKNATRSQRAAFKKQIYDAAARGEKIYPAR